MIIKQLQLRNFRNYELINLIFNQELNIITGNNAQGKTNLIESILYLSTTKSHRVSDDELLIKKHCDYSDISCDVYSKSLDKKVRILIKKNGKNLFINKNPINKVSDFIGEINAVLFCPDDLNLFSQSPKYRRKFIDIEISKISKQYTSILKEYYKLLKIRNAYLKRNTIDEAYLSILSDKMAHLQVIISKQRSKFIKDLIKYTNYFYLQFSNENLLIDCEYRSFIDEENIDVNYIKKTYEDNLEKDKMMNQTNFGIHKDDFIFKMGDYFVEEFASQGQKRLILLSIKLGLIVMIHKLTKEYPILLLDDVFSELDIINQQKLMNIIPNEVQTFITTCNKDVYQFEKNRNTTFFEIQEGKVI